MIKPAFFFKILHPDCPTGQKYDYYTDACQPDAYLGQACASDESYCPLVRGCVKNTVSDCSTANRRGIKLDSPTTGTSIPYKIVYVSSVGDGSHLLSI